MQEPRSKRKWLVRIGLALVLVVVALVLGAPALLRLLAGASERNALHDPDALSTEARALLADVLEGLDGAPLLDHHAHLGGVGRGSGCWVNPRMRSPLHPTAFVRFLSYLSAAGVKLEDDDRAFADGLLALVRSLPYPSRHALLAFDYRYDEEGAVDLDHSNFYVPNEYVWEVCARHPDVFEPCISIHPYREGALEELERWAERGVRMVKWLPNAMGIDPASPLCDAFYERMSAHRMVLLTHVGEEQAVEADGDQELGNPLRLRRALDAGVRVIAAHCASTGTSEDLDHPGERRTSFELFLRLMDEERYRGLLFGGISTVTQVNRFGNALETLLLRQDLHPRLVNGSDWPLPAVNVLYQTRALVKAGFLTSEERRVLNELYHYNPLLFDLALKRVVRAPGTDRRFPAELFRASLLDAE